jgi:hypothetical protein
MIDLLSGYRRRNIADLGGKEQAGKEGRRRAAKACREVSEDLDIFLPGFNSLSGDYCGLDKGPKFNPFWSQLAPILDMHPVKMSHR